MLAPTDFETPVMDHEALQVTQRIERCSRSGIDERNKANMLIRDISDVVK